MGPSKTAILLGVSLSIGAFGVTESRRASARVEAESAYTKAQTYSAALRYLRTELAYEVVERDPEAAYLIFKYKPPGQKERESNGSVEIIEASGKVRVYVQLPQMPEYHERVLRDGLMRKLRDEYGAPAPLPKPSAPKPAGDAGSD